MENLTGKRLDTFRLKLKEKGIDAAIIAKNANYFYLSGFTGSFAYLVITQNDAVLVTDFRYREQARVQAPLFQIVEYNDNIYSFLNEIVKSKGIEILGFEEDYITYRKFKEFENKFSVKELKPLEGIAEVMRMKKDQRELEIIKKAVKIADDAFNHILGFIKPGVKEVEIAAELEYFMKKQGAKGTSFETIVASGVRSALPHGVASEKVIEMGDVVTMDFGAVFEGYCSDMTRTVFVGKPKEELLKIYNTVLTAQKTALEGAVKGLKGKKIDAIAREIIYNEGFGFNFGHGLGHGVGIEIHEEPRLSPSGEIIMDDGMVVTVEPGIYVNGLGGVRIEDMIVINGNNPDVLTSSKKDMIVL
ncbi:aminopeptidase P family protein [Acetivibrio straminisolvens]|uniref:Aminopeptidase YpdF n=1 Tax=Acetivibrio straminisolvens JCM 21531 TaxID=1294263 RepID=W4V4G4_9FIRM|nr:aminopeptidase P family protein [Acetivibrio straminisolvens]GAE87639.1 aminopeptidase YpdF [Acetivibrio straminisolvens JCM 21531]